MKTPYITPHRLAAGIAKSRAYDHLNIKFGFHNAPRWLPVFATAYCTRWGVSEPKVLVREAK